MLHACTDATRRGPPSSGRTGAGEHDLAARDLDLKRHAVASSC
ncbi:Hypothetical protein A7982_10063 [Minicystis rosea]|nr:Hypothetical protein A7982_10063 [Minicystis rosea]